MQPQLERRPMFTPERSFVVQFGRETAIEVGRLVGRVEHVMSGKVARFQSLDELVVFMTEVLHDVAGGTDRDTPCGQR